MAEPNVLVERDGSVATVRLNRPKQLNALSGEVMDALVSALRELDEHAGRQFCPRCVTALQQLVEREGIEPAYSDANAVTVS